MARSLLLEGKSRHVAALLLLLRAAEVTMSDLRYALAKRGSRAGHYEVLAVVRDLVERGLVEERTVGVLARRRVRIYRLTERGVRVASALAELLGFPELGEKGVELAQPASADAPAAPALPDGGDPQAHRAARERTSS